MLLTTPFGTVLNCPECGTRLRKFEGRHGMNADERWICPKVVAGDHKGGVWNPMFRLKDRSLQAYTLRSPQNEQALRKILAEFQVIESENLAITKENEALPADKQKPLKALPRVDFGARPGDVVVDRALRTVYLVSADGSRRRCEDQEACREALDYARRLLAKEREIRNAQATATEQHHVRSVIDQQIPEAVTYPLPEGFDVNA